MLALAQLVFPAIFILLIVTSLFIFIILTTDFIFTTVFTIMDSVLMVIIVPIVLEVNP